MTYKGLPIYDIEFNDESVFNNIALVTKPAIQETFIQLSKQEDTQINTEHYGVIATSSFKTIHLGKMVDNIFKKVHNANYNLVGNLKSTPTTKRGFFWQNLSPHT